MKYLFGLMLVLLWTREAFTQSTFDYQVQIIDEESGQPLPGATLQFLNTTLADVADAEGKISFDSVPAGTYNIEVRFLGYRTVR